ncbi:MAG: molybdenum metabolism regulator, partial [Myxococcota bacterium]
ASVNDIGRILTGEGLPNLKHLGLANSEFENAIAQAVATAPIVARLETLDLSMGTMDDTGAQALLDNAANFTHLLALNVSDNFVSNEMNTQLRDAIGDNVRTSPPKDDDYRYRYVDVSE